MFHTLGLGNGKKILIKNCSSLLSSSYSLFVCLCLGIVTGKQIGTLIEGESLFNDGTAIILFNILLQLLEPGQSKSGQLVSLSLRLRGYDLPIGEQVKHSWTNIK